MSAILWAIGIAVAGFLVFKIGIWCIAAYEWFVDKLAAFGAWALMMLSIPLLFLVSGYYLYSAFDMMIKGTSEGGWEGGVSILVGLGSGCVALFAATWAYQTFNSEVRKPKQKSPLCPNCNARLAANSTHCSSCDARTSKLN